MNNSPISLKANTTYIYSQKKNHIFKTGYFWTQNGIDYSK